MDLTTWIPLLLGGVGFLVGGWAFTARPKTIEAPPAEMPRYDDTAVLRALDQHAAALEAHAGLIKETRAAVSHGIEHSERIERRIKGTVARAISELEDGVTPALRAEAEELGLFDGDGSPESYLPSMHEDVGEGSPSSVPGVTREQLQKVRFG